MPVSGPSTNEIRELAAHGLYDATNEHDACGLGFVAHIKGHKAHQHRRAGSRRSWRTSTTGAPSAPTR